MGRDKDTVTDKYTGNKNNNTETRTRQKKSGCCFKCCMSTLVIMMVLVIGGVGVGWFVGNSILEKYNVTVGQCLGSLVRLKDYKKAEDAVKNPYGEGDAQQFVDSLGSAVFLKGIKSSDIKDIMGDVLENALKTDDGVSPDENSSDDYIAKLTELFSDANIDRQKAQNYDENDANIENYYVNITDKSLAAFLNDIVLNTALNSPALKKTIDESLPDFFVLKDFDYKNALQISQILFYKDANGAGIKVTTRTNLNKTIDAAFKGLDTEKLLNSDNGFVNFGVKAGAAVAKPLIKAMLPAKIYLDIDMRAGADGKIRTQIGANAINEKDWEIFDSFLNSGGKPVSEAIDAMVDGLAGDKIENATQNVDFGSLIKTSGTGGAIHYDLVELLIDIFELNYDKGADGEKTPKPEDIQIKSGDVYFTLSALLSLNTEGAMSTEEKTGYDYTRWAFARDADNKLIYDDETGLPEMAGPNAYDPATMEAAKIKEYEDALLDAFRQSYGLGAETDFDQIFNLISGETLEFGKIFNPEIIAGLLAEENPSGVVLTDKMLAAIVANRYESYLTGVEGLDLTAVKPRYVALSEENLAAAGVPEELHNFIEVGIELDFAKMLTSFLSDDNLFAELFKKLLGQSTMLIGAKIDITMDDYNAGNPLRRAPVQISIDRLSFAKTRRIIKLVDNFRLFGTDAETGESIKFETFFGDMLSPLNDMITTMSNQLPGLTLGTSAMRLPDVFEAIVTVLNAGKTDNLIDKAEFKDNMNFMFRTVQTEDINGWLPDATFNDEIEYKFALEKGTRLTALFDSMENAQNDLLSLVTRGGLEALCDDPHDLSMLGVRMDDRMFGQLLLDIAASEKGASIRDYINADTLKHVKLYNENNQDLIEITVAVEVSSLAAQKAAASSEPDVEDGESESGGTDDTTDFITEVLKGHELYITLTLDITQGGDRAEPVFVLNRDEARTTELFAFLNKMGYSLDTTIADIKSMLSQNVASMFDTINGTGIISLAMDRSTCELVITDLFTAGAKIVSNSSTSKTVTEIDGEQFRAALRRMYADMPGSPQEYDYKGWYYTAIDKSAYQYFAPDSSKPEYGRVDFSEEFFGEIKANYALTETRDDGTPGGAPFTFGEFVNLMGAGGGAGSSMDIAEVIDSGRFKELVFEDMDKSKTYVDSLYLTGLILGQWETFMGSYQAISRESLDYSRAFSDIVDAGSNLQLRRFIEVAVTLNLDGNVISDAQIQRLVPETMQVSMVIDVTQGLDEGEYLPTLMKYNGRGEPAVDRLIEMIKGKDSFDFEAIAKSVRDAFDGMAKKTGLEFCGDHATHPYEGLYVSNVFDLINKLSYTEGTFENGADIQDALKGIYTPEKYGFDLRNPVSDSVVLTDLLSAQIDTVLSAGYAAVDDRDLGALLKGRISFGTPEALNIISAQDYGMGGKGDAERAWLEGYVPAGYAGADAPVLEFDTADYLSITFSINMNDFASIDSTVARKILPDAMFGTILLVYSKGVFEYVMFRINDMDIGAQKNLYKLTGNEREDEHGINGTVQSYFASSRDQLDIILNAEMQNALNNLAVAPVTALTIDTKEFIAAPSEGTPVGRYRMHVTVGY